jgi:hypothetical protein
VPQRFDFLDPSDVQIDRASRLRRVLCLHLSVAFPRPGSARGVRCFYLGFERGAGAQICW